jgi:two-component system nitrogen regulation sensor histidine kinase GlnL
VPSSRPVRRPRPERAADRLGWTDVLASISDAVIILDTRGMVADVNPAAELLTGTAASQAIGLPVARTFGGRPGNGWLGDITAASLAEAVTHRRAEETLVVPGHEVLVSAACAPILDADGVLHGAVLVLHDLTFQHTLETATRRAERLSALSTVTAGLAHEIRNPLGGIKGAAQLLRTALTDPDQIRCTDLIVREVERLDGLVDQLRALDTPPMLEVAPVNIHRVLNDVIDLERQAPEWGTTALIAEFDPSLPPVLGDRAQLLQVFLNLVKNAVEAVGGAGTVTIATRMDAGYRVRRSGGDAQFLAVTISDTGPGVADVDVPRLFAPFFTTKARGSGLGLALCHRVVIQHGGAITYETPSRGGARFRVSLPVTEDHGV